MKIEQLYKPLPEQIQAVEWTGDAEAYDCHLYELGQSNSKSLVVNPFLSDSLLVHYIEEIPETEKCVVWTHNDEWVAKLFSEGWTPEVGYETIKLVKPKIVWNRNPDIDKLMKFEDDPFGSFEPEPWDRNYKHVWYIDPRFNPLPDKVWIVSCQPMGRPVQGTKEMGFLTPDVTVEFNDHLPDLGIDIDDCCPPFWELASECAYELDPIHQTGERLWVVKFTPNYRKPRGWKWLGVITPQYKIEHNPDLPKLDYEIDYIVPWHDLGFEHVWMLDRKHLQNGEDDIWAVKIKFLKDVEGEKIVDYITPEVYLEYNKDLPDLDYLIEYEIPWHDLGFEHVWMLDRKHLQHGEDDIWAVKAKCLKKTKGTKVIGEVSPNITLEYNKDLPDLDYLIEYEIPWHDLSFEHVWMLDRKHLQNGEDDIWAVKARCLKKTKGTKVIGEVSPNITLEYNKDLPKLEYTIDYEIPWHDLSFEHVWTLDRKHLQHGEDDIWAVKAKCLKKTKGTKIIGEVSPNVVFEYNKDLPKLEYTIDYEIPWHDLAFEHVWMLDRKHLQNGENDIWAVKITCTKDPAGTKDVGTVSPNLKLEVNPELRGYAFDVSYDIPYYDFSFLHVWTLDASYTNDQEIWAVKLKAANSASEWKDMGTIEPSSFISYNPALKNLRIDIDYKIPYHDRKYVHVWYLDTAYTNGEKIWAAKMQASDKASGQKEMGYVTPIFPDCIDVIFISYNERDAEKNWQRVLEKVPQAKRVDGVKGIFEAHKAAAKLATTDMFYVVDGDAYLTDDWSFDFQPGIFDRDCTYIWYSKNPINSLTYGYGGVKLFPRKKLLELKNWSTLDLSTSVTEKIKIVEKVSNYTYFNTDAFSTWRSVFRECVKLYVNNYNHPETFEHQFRLDQWLEVKDNTEYSDIVLDAAKKAIKFAEANIKNKKELIKINDRDWLESQFKNTKV